MEHFKIHDIDAPWTDSPTDVPTMFSALDGHVDCLRLNGFNLWVEDNPAESIMVHVAAKRRYGTLDTVADDQPFTILNTQGAY